MQSFTTEITKEQFDKCPRGFVPPELEPEFFDGSILHGYGLYRTRVYEKDGKYFLDFKIGDTCD